MFGLPTVTHFMVERFSLCLFFCRQCVVEAATRALRRRTDVLTLKNVIYARACAVFAMWILGVAVVADLFDRFFSHYYCSGRCFPLSTSDTYLVGL